MASILESLLELVYPTQCALCGRSGQLICAACFDSLSFIESDICLQCGKPSYFQAEQCRECRGKQFVFSQSRSLGLYQGNLKELIYKLKYGNCRGLAKIFAQLLIDHIESDFFLVDLVTSVPLSKEKQSERGFNQAQLLAEHIAGKLNQPFVGIIYQRKETEDQSKLQADERRKNVREAFGAKQDLLSKGMDVLLVDDVFTTGSTANECSKVLRKAGAGSIRVVTIARSTYLI